ncbi:hypothetical protein KIN20_035323 [Parelaphostrongylus tenuis]|uniref:Uncharacterized protein n=1 Tax=Parelaphostrongylus tenuis TaxID=148309 RepID=A0AAD5RBE3_PARTN|nr:hypothetical protein KIN20_035323 [Parelaphostrongylus tenuis]
MLIGDRSVGLPIARVGAYMKESLSQGTANKRTVERQFKNSRERDESLEEWERRKEEPVKKKQWSFGSASGFGKPKAPFDATRQCHTAHCQNTKDKIDDKLNGVEVSRIPPTVQIAFHPALVFSDPNTTPFEGSRFESFDEVEDACHEFFDSKSEEWYFDQIRNLADR